VGVESAKLLSEQPSFIRRGKVAAKFATGVRYERKVGEYLELWALGRAEISLRLGQWMQFKDRSGTRWCQVDALWAVPAKRLALICEIKYQHTADAWWQLKHLYIPVLGKALPGYTLGMLEIVHWLDPGVVWPEEYRRVSGLDECLYDATVNVTILNPSRQGSGPKGPSGCEPQIGQQAGSIAHES
jgi:hypothetical protein